MMSNRALGGIGTAAVGDFLSFPSSNGVVCPRPRRVGVSNHARASRCHSTNVQNEVCDSEVGSELLDVILTKSNSVVALSPPFFVGSPPCRVSNPVIEDSQFGYHKFSPLSPAFDVSPSCASKNGGSCAKVKLSQMPAPVRIEGFNCHGSGSISTFA